MGGVNEVNQPGVLQGRHRLLNEVLVVRDHRVAVGGLIARRDQGVQREGVLLRRRQLLLDEAADHPSFLEAQAHAQIIRLAHKWSLSDDSSLCCRCGHRRERSNCEKHVDRASDCLELVPDWSGGKAGINKRAAAFANSSTTTRLGTYGCSPVSATATLMQANAPATSYAQK
jgi:hypothetical protein